MSSLVRSTSRLFFGSAIAGAGLMFGRSTYKSGKGYSRAIAVMMLGVLALIGMVYLPYYAGKEMFRGHRRGFFKTIFATIFWNAIISAIGYGLIIFFCLLFADKLPNGDPRPPHIVYAENWHGILKFFCIFYILGMLVGLLQRHKRKRIFIIEDENEAFLKRHGIIETGIEAAPYQDAKGNSLKLLQAEKSQLIFMVVGRRNKRAFINLDKFGKMMKYTGPMKLYP